MPARVGAEDLDQCCQIAKFDPFFSLDCVRVEGVGYNPKKEGIKFCSVGVA